MPTYINFEFVGTATRREFWLNQLCVLGAAFGAMVLMGLLALAAGDAGEELGRFGLSLVALAGLVASLSIAARRCRQLGLPAWTAVLLLVPFICVPAYLYLGLATQSNPKA